MLALLPSALTIAIEIARFSAGAGMVLGTHIRISGERPYMVPKAKMVKMSAQK